MGNLFSGPMSKETARIALVRAIDAAIDGMDDDDLAVDEPSGVGFVVDEVDPGVLQVTVHDYIEDSPDVVFLIKIEEVTG